MQIRYINNVQVSNIFGAIYILVSVVSIADRSMNSTSFPELSVSFWIHREIVQHIAVTVDETSLFFDQS